MTSLAIDYHGGGVLRERRYTPIDPGPDEVSIAVAFTGICGTDLKIVHGAMDHRITSPWPIGHEMSGTIEAVGSDVDGWQRGDQVTVMPLEWCNRCPACARGHRHVCQNLVFVGIDSPGSLQQRWNVPARLLVRIPDHVSLQTAALSEPTAVAVHDVRRGGVGAADQVVVIGGGPIGLLIGLVASHVGADVLVSEPATFRRRLASELGLRTIDPTADDLNATVADWSSGKGAEVAFEVSGSQAGVRALTEELDIAAARVYRREDFEEAVALLADEVIHADSLITDVVPLSETAAAVARLASGEEVVKLLIDSR